MDLSFINKIPGLRSVDLSRAATRRNLAMGLFGGALAILVIVLKIAQGSHKDADNGQIPHEPDRKRFSMTVPEGEDRDREVLGATSMIAARENGRRGGRDLYERGAGGDDEDPYAVISEKKSKNQEEETDTRTEREKAVAAFHDQQHVTPATGKEESPAPPAREQKPSKPRTVSVNRPSPQTQSQPQDQPRPPKSEPETKEEPAPEAETEVQAEPVKIRRTGGVSSLSDEWGTVTGIGSLESGEEYVVQDDDKPYKVMFLRDQKVRSGDRVALRLLEDMVADGILIPRNTHLSAVCQVGERLQVTVSNIEIGGRIHSLDYIAFDNDGGEGLYCPEAVTARKGEQAAQSLGQTAISSVTSLISATAGSLAGNAARIGAQTVTSRNGTVAANISSGYTFYLLKR